MKEPSSQHEHGCLSILVLGLMMSSLVVCIGAEEPMVHLKTSFLPDAKAAKILTVTPASEWDTTGITVLTEAVAVKETGPKETVARFGEVYAFSPTFIALHRDRATTIHFRNLQPDDEHDLAVLDHAGNKLMDVKLPPLQETSYVFTFHQEGLFDFECTIHQPGMSGQFLILPPDSGAH